MTDGEKKEVYVVLNAETCFWGVRLPREMLCTVDPIILVHQLCVVQNLYIYIREI